MRVAEIWSYPVKSMLGSTVPSAELDAAGIRGDRLWAVRDAATGALRGGKKLGELMRCSATLDSGSTERARIVLPDGTQTGTDASDVHQRLSAVLGADVVLAGRPGPGDSPRGREAPPVGVDPLSEIRAVMGREDDEPLPDFAVFPEDVLQYEGPLAGYYDAFPLLIMTTSTMRTLQAALPDSVIDIRRFRPSVVVDTGDEPGYPEFTWGKGTRWRIGEAVVEIDAPCPRCVMPTRAINADIPADRSILRYIVRELDQNLGVYARVIQSGRISSGDELSRA